MKNFLIFQEHHLKAHQFTHTGLRPWVCEVCNRSFNQKANMVRHLLIHSERRQYNCQMCEKSFSQPQTLKAHMVVHAEQKPFQCQICSKYLYICMCYSLMSNKRLVI